MQINDLISPSTSSRGDLGWPVGRRGEAAALGEDDPGWLAGSGDDAAAIGKGDPGGIGEGDPGWQDSPIGEAAAIGEHPAGWSGSRTVRREAGEPDSSRMTSQEGPDSAMSR